MSSFLRARIDLSEDGMTLIEMIVSIVILAIIMGPLTISMVVILRNTTITQARLSVSHDRQFAKLYLPQDLSSALSSSAQSGQSQGGVAFTPRLAVLNSTSKAGGVMCSGAIPSASSPYLFSVTWAEVSGLGLTSGSSLGFDYVEYEADYYQTSSGSVHQLRRLVCETPFNPAAGTTQTDSDVSVMDNAPSITGSSYTGTSTLTLTVKSSSPTTCSLTKPITCPDLTSVSSINIVVPDSSGSTTTYTVGGVKRSA